MEVWASSLLSEIYQRAGFGPEDVPSRRVRADYSSRVMELEPTFRVLSLPELPYGTIPALAKASNIPRPTLRHWRERLRQDESWRPGERYGETSRLLTDEEETQLADTIRRDYIAQHKYCPPKLVARLGKRARHRRDLDEWDGEDDSSESSDDSEEGKKHRHRGQFTHTWRTRFMHQHGFSLRRPHVRRRSKPDDEFLAQFLTNTQMAIEQYPRDRILNVDETSWKIINNRMITVAECGADEVTCEFDGDVKRCVTVIASIDASGRKLPLWVICRGKTTRCEADLRGHFTREIRSGRLVLTHEENGWTNAAVAIEYLQWLSDGVKGQELFLLWDCFSAHRDEEVKAKASDSRITLQLIPAGMTNEWQPLDLRIFGSLKMRARELFDEQWMRDESVELTVATAITVLLKAWASVTQDEVLGAWDKVIG
jgi:hypothetical protein